MNQINKLIEVSNKIVNEYSPDGWYWQINKNIGDIYAKHKYLKKANEQYNLSINGIKKRAKNEAKMRQKGCGSYMKKDWQLNLKIL